MADSAQTQKELEAQRQKELDELFAEAIKQPKVPVGENYLTFLTLLSYPPLPIVTILNAIRFAS